MARRKIPIVWHSLGCWWVSVVDDSHAHRTALAQVHQAKVQHGEGTWKDVPDVERHHYSRIKGYVVYKEVPK